MNQASADLVGPTPYLQASDSPFARFTFDYFHLEDFEDELFDVPGVTASTGRIIGPGLAADSVDGDDGLVDGSGNGGRSLFVVSSTPLTFTFDPAVLGSLPTHAGFVRTDGGNAALGTVVSFEAFGPGMVSLGTIGPIPFGDGISNGTTAEDRFFGWIDAGGILAIRMSPGTFEVDHLQYGSSVPEPSAAALLVVAFVVVSLYKLRSVLRLEFLPTQVLAAALAGPPAFYSIAAATEPFFLGLGDLPGGSFESAAYGISADGSVIVGASQSASGNEAFRWTQAGGLIGLGDPSVATDVSADGSVIVGQWGAQAFRWTQASGKVGLGDFPGGAFRSFAGAVSADGSVVAGIGWGTRCTRGGCTNTWPVARWTEAGIGRPGMSVVPVFDNSLPLDISADGNVIVAGRSEAEKWTLDGGMTPLGDLPGGDVNSRAYGVSADGSVIVGVGNAVTNISGEAFRWTQNSGMVGLGILSGFDSSLAQDVSSDGSIVVGTLGLGAESAGAFIWNATHGMRNLQDVLINDFGLGASLAGWNLSDASAISADGRVIVGYGTNPSGNTEAWIARLAQAAMRPGDFNNDGAVDAADYAAWRKNFSGDQAMYDAWRANFGSSLGPDSGSVGYPLGASAAPLSAAVPEPDALVLLLVVVIVNLAVRLSRR